jgi:hypothetical protein
MNGKMVKITIGKGMNMMAMIKKTIGTAHGMNIVLTNVRLANAMVKSSMALEMEKVNSIGNKTTSLRTVMKVAQLNATTLTSLTHFQVLQKLASVLHGMVTGIRKESGTTN